MNWNKLKAFYYAAKTGSFSNAASIMNISQPALSRQIIDIEKELKASLFKRTPRGISITKQGKILFDTSKEVFAKIERAQNEIDEENYMPKGHIRIAATYGVASFYLATNIKEFMHKYPEINVTIIGTEFLPNFESHDVDAIIRPYVQGTQKSLQEFLMTSEYGLFASKSYLEKFGTPTKPKDLDKHRLIGFGEKNIDPFIYANWHLTLGATKGYVRQPCIRINSGAGLCELAKQGIGIMCISKKHPYLNHNDLVEVLPNVNGPVANIYYITSACMAKSKRIKIFGEFLKETLSKY